MTREDRDFILDCFAFGVEEARPLLIAELGRMNGEKTGPHNCHPMNAESLLLTAARKWTHPIGSHRSCSCPQCCALYDAICAYINTPLTLKVPVKLEEPKHHEECPCEDCIYKRVRP